MIHNALLLSLWSVSLAAGADVLFRNVRLFDGRDIQPQTSVLIRDGKIVSVGPTLRARNGAEVVDGRGKTLLPALIDAHTHDSTIDALRQAVRLGVATQIDLYRDPKVATAIRAEQVGGRGLDRADLFSAGLEVTCPRGWRPNGKSDQPVPTLSDPAGADAFIADRIREGSEFITIILDDQFGRRPTFNRDTLTAAVEAARRHHKLPIVYARFTKYVRLAVESGAAGLATFYWPDPPDPDLPKLIHDRGLFMITPLTIVHSEWDLAGDRDPALDQRLSKYLFDWALEDLKWRSPRKPPREVAEQRYRTAEKAVYEMYIGGVPILAGTGAGGFGTTYGASLHRELELLVQAGLRPVDALRSATSIPAKLLGLKDRGVVVPSARADLLLVEGDPSTDILDTRNIVGVWKKGTRIVR